MSENSLDTALNPKTFSVLDAIKGRAYPTDEVTVYYNTEAVYRLKGLENQRLALDMLANNAKKGDEANQIDAKIAELDPKIAAVRAEVEASGVTFEMRGFAPAVRDSLVDEARAKFDVPVIEDESEANNWLHARAIAESIIRVKAADGSVDEHRWNADEVMEISHFLVPEEFGKITGLALLLSYTSFEFDARTSADFS